MESAIVQELIQAATELNERLGLVPQIDTTASPDAMWRSIREAATLVEPADELSPGTENILRMLSSSEDHTLEEASEEVSEEASEEASEEVSEEASEEVLVGAPTPKKGKASKRQSMTLSGRVFGAAAMLSSIIDKEVVRNGGGDWLDLLNRVQERAKSVGINHEKISLRWLRNHLKQRLHLGWLDAGIYSPLDLVMTSEGITITIVEE